MVAASSVPKWKVRRVRQIFSPTRFNIWFYVKTFIKLFVWLKMPSNNQRNGDRVKHETRYLLVSFTCWRGRSSWSWRIWSTGCGLPSSPTRHGWTIPALKFKKIVEKMKFLSQFAETKLTLSMVEDQIIPTSSGEKYFHSKSPSPILLTDFLKINNYLKNNESFALKLIKYGVWKTSRISKNSKTKRNHKKASSTIIKALNSLVRWLSANRHYTVYKNVHSTSFYYFLLVITIFKQNVCQNYWLAKKGKIWTHFWKHLLTMILGLTLNYTAKCKKFFSKRIWIKMNWKNWKLQRFVKRP